MCCRWRLFPAASAHSPSHPVQAEPCSKQTCLPAALSRLCPRCALSFSLSLSRLLASSPTRLFSVWLSRSLSLSPALCLSCLPQHGARSIAMPTAVCRSCPAYGTIFWQAENATRALTKGTKRQHGPTMPHKTGSAHQPPIGMVTA